MANESRMEYAILGLLCHEDLTGYEIKQCIDSALRFFWNASFGSIYPKLHALEEDGLIRQTGAGGGERGKIAYAITEQGLGALKSWLEIPAAKDELRYETLLKLFFSDAAGPQAAIGHIERFEEKSRRELAELEKAAENLRQAGGDGAHKYYLATAMLGVKTFRAYLEWCEEAKRLLRENA